MNNTSFGISFEKKKQLFNLPFDCNLKNPRYFIRPCLFPVFTEER